MKYLLFIFFLLGCQRDINVTRTIKCINRDCPRFNESIETPMSDQFVIREVISNYVGKSGKYQKEHLINCKFLIVK